jgi:flavin reductase (DIM6/NTAB) family NADH-FMN oxidoreductase RutF/putative methionine-R-sulfoxide reductase with GAF domain
MKLDPKEHPWLTTYHTLTDAVQPRPIALVATIDREGRGNLAPFSFYNVVCAKPPIVAFSPLRRGRDGSHKDTLKNLRAVPELTISAVTEDNVQRVNQTSFDYPAGVDELQAVGLRAVPSERVTPPRVADSPVTFECRLHAIHDFGDEAGGGSLVLAEILLAHIDDDVLTNGRIDPSKLKAVGRMGQMEYARTRDRLTIPRPMKEDPLYRTLFALVHEDTRAAKERLQDAVSALHAARPRHSWTGVYLLRGEMLDLAAYVGPQTEHTRIPIGKGLCGLAVTQGTDLDIADVNARPEYLACSITTKAEAIALIWHRGKIIAQIDIDSDAPGEFGAEAMRSLATVAELIAPLAAEALL